MFTLAAIKCWLYKLSHYEYSYGSSIKYNKLTEYTYNYEDVNNGQWYNLFYLWRWKCRNFW